MVHQAAVDAEFGKVAQLDAVEVLDPADPAAHHAQQPLRFLPLPAGAVGAAEHTDAGGEAVGRADGLVEFHQAPGDGGQPAVLALHLVQAAPELAGQDVDAVADADDGLLGGGRAVELRLDADQRGSEDLAQLGLEVGAHLGALLHGRQDVVDGVTGPQSAHRVGQLLVGEPGDGGQLVAQLLLPCLGPLGEPALVDRGLLGQPVLVDPGLFRQLCLVRLYLLGELGVQGGALGGEPLLQSAHVLLPLLGVFGPGGAVGVLGPAQLCAGAQQEAHAHGAGRGGRRAGDGHGYSLGAHERGGHRPASQAQWHQPPAVPGDGGPRRRWRSGEFHLHPSKQNDRTGGSVRAGVSRHGERKGGPHS